MHHNLRIEVHNILFYETTHFVKRSPLHKKKHSSKGTISNLSSKAKQPKSKDSKSNPLSINASLYIPQPPSCLNIAYACHQDSKRHVHASSKH